MAITQENRRIQVFTPLPENTLLFHQMYGRESLNEPFEYNLELLSTDLAIDPRTILGESITLKIQVEDGSWRYFNGLVSRFGQAGNINAFARYRATLRPWLWFLTRASNCRIFQNQSATDIIKKVFRDQGFSDFEEKLSGNYPVREYCVQYRETDFNFVSRLMEEEGIGYYFSHTEHKHSLVLADAVGSHATFPGYADIPYHDDTGSSDRARRDHVHDWGLTQEVQPSAYEITDYDFKKPNSKLLVKSHIKEGHAQEKFKFFDYPGRYTETGAGENLVRYRIEEQHARFERCEAKCNARGLTVGYLFSLTEYPLETQNRKYLVVSADYHLLLDEYVSGSSSGDENFFACSFIAQDSTTPYRPIRNTPKPLVHGAQTAVVTGPSGEEIYTDKYGRVKVQFHWDRYGTNNEESSCWIRVAHPWAGKNWGMVAIPRMGHEVVVEFLEGDPDQPLIVGSVYNADMMPPYDLPANATQTGIKSRSSKGGGTANFNEIRFEDKMGSEEMYIHAEKDQNILVENDRGENIGRDRSLEVGRDKFETVDRNKQTLIKGYHDEKINGDMTVMVAKNLTETVAINYAETVGATMELSVGAALAISVGAAMTETVGLNKIVSIGRNQDTSIGKNFTFEVGESYAESVAKNKTVEIGKNQTETIGGKYDETVKEEYMIKAKKMQIVAEEEISLKTGSAEIIMKKNGDITVKGKNINIKGDGDITIKGSSIKEN